MQRVPYCSARDLVLVETSLLREHCERVQYLKAQEIFRNVLLKLLEIIHRIAEERLKENWRQLSRARHAKPKEIYQTEISQWSLREYLSQQHLV